MNIIMRRNSGHRNLSPFHRPLSRFEDIDRLAREMWDSWRPVAVDYVRAPRTDIYQEDGQLVVKAEFPGVEKDDLEITLEGDRLTISAEKKEEGNDDAEHHARERYYGRYSRSLTLPFPVKESKITATFENGVLELKLPRADEVKPMKIEIKSQLPEGEPKKRQRKPKKTNNQ